MKWQSPSISHSSLVGWSLKDQIRAHSTRSVVTTVTRLQFSFSDLQSIQVEFITVNHSAWSSGSRLRKQSKLEMAALLNLLLVQNVRPPTLSHIPLICSNLLSREVSITICCCSCTIPKIFMNLKAEKLQIFS